MLLNHFKLVVVTLFHSFAILRRNWIHWTTFESLSLHLLMNFSFWWHSVSDELASDDVITSGALLTLGAVLLQMLLSFLFDKFFALFCSSRTYKWSQKFCLWSCTLEQILAYPINNFLIPCYHSKLLRVMLNIFCSNKYSLHFFSFDVLGDYTNIKKSLNYRNNCMVYTKISLLTPWIFFSKF